MRSAWVEYGSAEILRRLWGARGPRSRGSVTGGTETVGEETEATEMIGRRSSVMRIGAVLVDATTHPWLSFTVKSMKNPRFSP